MKKSLYFLLLFNIIFQACKTEVRSAGELPNITIHLPTRSDDMTRCLKVFHKKNQLYFLDDFGMRVNIYDLESGNLVDSILFELNGPNAIPRPTGFTILPDGSIAVSESGKGIYKILDTKGQLTNQINYTFSDEDHTSTYSPLNSRVYNDLVYLKGSNKIIIPQQSYAMGDFAQEMKTYHTKPMCLIYENGTITQCAAKYPENYFNGKYLPTSLYQASLNGVALLSVPHSDLVTAIDGKMKIVSKPIASQFYKAPTFEYGPNTREDFTANSCFYGSIITDEVNDVFYRIVKLEHNETDRPEDYQKTNEGAFPLKFSIIKCDKDLKILEERVFEGGKFNIENCFVYKGHLYFSANSPYADYEEGTLTFQALF